MSASDSHRAEVREYIELIIEHARVNATHFTHSSDDANKNINYETDKIMALLDSERERWIGEVKAVIPTHLAPDDVNPQPLDKYERGYNAALDAVSKVLDSYNAG